MIVASETGDYQEVRGRGFRSLILRSNLFGEERITMIRAALAICVQYRGIWPEPEELMEVTGAEDAATWIHHHIKSGDLSLASTIKTVQNLMR